MNKRWLEIVNLLLFNKNQILWLLVFFSLCSAAQEKKRVEVLHAGVMETNEKIVAHAQRLLDSVIIRHNNVLMYCDSAYAYNNSNRVDFFGHVFINQADTIHLYADQVQYDGDRSFAESVGNVRLQSKNATLYTDTLDYDLNKDIGYYEDNGKIVDSTNVLTSVIGRFHVNEDLAYFYQNVRGNSKDYELYSDTLAYNTQTGRILIESRTTIRDSSNILYAKDGWYDTKTGEAHLIKEPVVFNNDQQLKANIINYSREQGNGDAEGNVAIYDFKNSMIVKGGKAFYNEKLKTALVTDSALLILYSREDSLYLHADTLKTVPDTIEKEKIIKAYTGVRFWRKDIQGVCDSLNYFTRDSTVQLFINPILWSENRQLTADYIEMKSNTNKPDEVRLDEDAFIISKLDSVMYNQIKGRNMIGYIQNNKLFRIDVDGNGQTLYYAEDKGDKIGLNHAESSKISIRFKEGKISFISLLSDPEGTLKPTFQIESADRKLQGFTWKEDIRPLSKEDIYRK